MQVIVEIPGHILGKLGEIASNGWASSGTIQTEQSCMLKALEEFNAKYGKGLIIEPPTLPKKDESTTKKKEKRGKQPDNGLNSKEVAELFANGMKQAEIARKFSVTDASISYHLRKEGLLIAKKDRGYLTESQDEKEMELDLTEDSPAPNPPSEPFTLEGVVRKYEEFHDMKRVADFFDVHVKEIRQILINQGVYREKKAPPLNENYVKEGDFIEKRHTPKQETKSDLKFDARGNIIIPVPDVLNKYNVNTEAIIAKANTKKRNNGELNASQS